MRLRCEAKQGGQRAAATTQAPARGDIREVAQQIISRVENMINFFTENPLRLASLSTLPHYLHCPDDTLEAVAALLALPIDSEFPKLLRGILRWIPAAAADNNVCTFMSKKLLQMLNVQYSKSEQTQTPPDCVSIMHLVSEIILCTMDTLASTAHMRKLMSETLLKLLDDMEGAGMIQLDIVAGILRYRLVNCGDFDRMMVRWVERGRTSSSMINVPQLDFVHLLLQRCCLEHRTHYGIDFPRCCEQFMKTAERRRRMNTQQAQQLQPQELQILQQTERIMESLTQQLQLADEEPTALESRPPSRLCVTSRYTEKDKEDRPGKMSFSEETAAKFIAEWHEAVKTNSDTPPSLEHMGTAQNRLVGNMLTKVMQMLLSTNSFHEDICELFFKYACESVVKVTLQDARPLSLRKRKGPEKTHNCKGLEFAVVSVRR
ncbi:unnamed protein product [Effrenium voratum]|nr:unnamed protein product [Effrenium voratum]